MILIMMSIIDTPDVGALNVRYFLFFTKLVSDIPDHPQAHNKELKEISFKEWKKDNEGYV
jgi:hypothetical protein